MSDKLSIPEWYDEELKKILRDQEKGVSPASKITPKLEWQVARHKLLAQLFMARRKQGLTQTELAQKTGLPQSTLARIESGRINPNLKTLLKLSNALGVELIVQRRQP